MNSTNLDNVSSIWLNPLKVPQKLVFATVPGGRSAQYVIPPGEKREIPAVYDHAIQVRSGSEYDGNDIVGGMAPNLIKVGVHDLNSNTITEISPADRFRVRDYLMASPEDFFVPKAVVTQIASSSKVDK